MKTAEIREKIKDIFEFDSPCCDKELDKFIESIQSNTTHTALTNAAELAHHYAENNSTGDLGEIAAKTIALAILTLRDKKGN